MAMMNGVRQWMFQRTANVFLVAFGLVLFVTLLNGVTYESLTGMLGSTWFKFFALITLILGCLNSVLAGWQIVGDYAKKFHLPAPLLLVIIGLVTLVYLVVGLGLIF